MTGPRSTPSWPRSNGWARRWAPTWDAGFTAAYFDHAGLYAFGRQPEALHWNCGQLAVSLRQLSETEPLVAALERFPELYRVNLARRFLWRLGLSSRAAIADQIASTSSISIDSGLGSSQ